MLLNASIDWDYLSGERFDPWVSCLKIDSFIKIISTNIILDICTNIIFFLWEQDPFAKSK